MLRFNENNEVIREDEYKAILVGLQRNEDISYSMEELKGLAEAANVEVLGQMIQNLERPNTATLIGKGKVEELAEMAKNMEADTVIFNDELTGMQLRNLEDAVGVRVIDRTILILDIFASRATSKEGKLQVELAQLAYRMPRLTGFGKSLSRLGGGIGTRGPGEKKLETDRRHIERRMYDIKSELAQLKNTRSVQRARREKSSIPVVALVGYTNSGKSALMNRILALTEKEEKTVFEKNMLFATLDTTVRKIHLPDKREFLLSDTVGFISKLPHNLVEAFHSTLEEVKFANLLLEVVDYSDEHYMDHMEVTRQTLKELGADEIPCIHVFNKCDIAKANGREDVPAELPHIGKDCIYMAAGQNIGLEELVQLISNHIYQDYVECTMLIPYTEGALVSYFNENATVKETEYEAEGTKITMSCLLKDLKKYKEYVIL